MPRFLVDTSCMIAALCSWHEHHQRAIREIEQRLDNGETLVVAAPALIEAYAVMTRLPPPHRLSPAASLTLLATSFMTDDVEVVALDAEGYRHLLHGAAGRGIAGGRTYDAVICACGEAGRVSQLLTFNERQFLSLTTGEMQIVSPA